MILLNPHHSTRPSLRWQRAQAGLARAPSLVPLIRADSTTGCPWRDLQLQIFWPESNEKHVKHMPFFFSFDFEKKRKSKMWPDQFHSSNVRFWVTSYQHLHLPQSVNWIGTRISCSNEILFWNPLILKKWIYNLRTSQHEVNSVRGDEGLLKDDGNDHRRVRRVLKWSLIFDLWSELRLLETLWIEHPRQIVMVNAGCLP